MTTYIKDPDAVLDYCFDFSNLLESGEVIDEHTIIGPDGITVDSSSHTTTAVTFWLSGGSNLEHYSITCRIETSAGRIDDRTMIISVREK